MTSEMTMEKLQATPCYSCVKYTAKVCLDKIKCGKKLQKIDEVEKKRSKIMGFEKKILGKEYIITSKY